MSPVTTIRGVLAHARQEHLHLRNRGVLTLVEDDHGVVQRPPAHVGQRGDLDQVVVHVPADLLVVHQVVQRIEQGPQIGVDLGLEVARQEAQVLAGLDRRPHQHDLLDPPAPQERNGHRHRQVGFARSRRPDAEDQLVFQQRLHVARLTVGTGPDRPVPSRISSVAGLLGLRAMQRRIDQVADIGSTAIVVARAVNRPQPLEDPPRLLDPVGVSLDPDLAVPRQNLHSHRVANLPEILVSTAEDGKLFGMTLQTDRDFRHACPFAAPFFQENTRETAAAIPRIPSSTQRANSKPLHYGTQNPKKATRR